MTVDVWAGGWCVVEECAWSCGEYLPAVRGNVDCRRGRGREMWRSCTAGGVAEMIEG
jgi:hypothetical protein